MSSFSQQQPPNERVVIVDSDPAARAMIRAVLAPYDLSVTDLLGSDAALQHLSDQPVDLVITDLLMPQRQGLELCRRLKAHPEWRFIPIILVSALDDLGSMACSFEAGADDFLCKPLDKSMLRARVQVLLRIRRHYCELLHAKQTISVESLVQQRTEEMAASAQLSPRERQVLDLLLAGYVNEEIALLLEISPRTVKFHTANTLRKLGVESRNALLRGLFPASPPGPRYPGTKPTES